MPRTHWPSFVAILALASSATGQIREECPPYPSRASEFDAYRDEVKARKALPKISVSTLTLHTDGNLTAPEKSQITEAVKQITYSADPNWPAEFNERLSDALQKLGFFKAIVVESKSRVLSGSPKRVKAAVTATVEEGQHYALKEITFRSVIQPITNKMSPNTTKDIKTFPSELLRNLFPIQDGDVFDTSKIRIGLNSLRKLYGGKGYINFIPIPDTKTDDVKRTVSLEIVLDQGKVYRLSNIEIQADTEAQRGKFAKLANQAGLRESDPFNAESIKEFFKQNRSILPEGTMAEETSILRDDANATVSVTLHLRGC